MSMEQAAAVRLLKTFSQGREAGEAEPLTAPQKVRSERGPRASFLPLTSWRLGGVFPISTVGSCAPVHQGMGRSLSSPDAALWR
jgi:hypothetical protein